MTIQKKPVCLSLWNDKFAEFNLHQHFGLDPDTQLVNTLKDQIANLQQQLKEKKDEIKYLKLENEEKIGKSNAETKH